MWPLYAIVALFLAPCPSRAALQRDVDDSLQKIFDVRLTARNDTGRAAEIPGYMYRLYQDASYRRYDVIRRISPKTESLEGFMQFVYDLSALEPTEVVQKAVLQLEPRPNYQFRGAINVSLFSLTKQTLSKTYLGSASISSAFDLENTLSSQSLIDLDRLIVQIEGQVELSIGLVLYSKTLAGRYPKGHELAKFLFENTINERRRRSVYDNEIDVKQNNPTDESKRKKKKKKGSKFSKLQAVDAGDSIVITNEDQCRMEKLVLNFADIGWEDWVIYPKGFETNYCAGNCLFPLGKGSKPTNHATVQSLARSFGRLWDIPEPSCVPDTLAPLTLLYMDHSNHVLLKSYPDMRVMTCSCK